MGKRALITGITGQDGSYLAELLLKHGYEVHGLVRTRTLQGKSLEHLSPIRDRITLHPGDLLDSGSLVEAMRASCPDEIYNLAAMSVVTTSWDQASLTGEHSGVGVARMLEAMREACPDARFCQASSSEMFGKAREVPQNELTPLCPLNPYGAAKTYGHFITVAHRKSFDLFACSAILFNHESPRRRLEFVSRKITHGAAQIKLGLTSELRLGNLDARRDWGYAPDYVEAMWLMLQQDSPEDFVVGTGEDHSVRDFVDIAFAKVDLDPAEHVSEDPALVRAAELDRVIADPSKAYERLGWRRSIDFEQLVELMVKADIDCLAERSDIGIDH